MTKDERIAELERRIKALELEVHQIRYPFFPVPSIPDVTAPMPDYYGQPMYIAPFTTSWGGIGGKAVTYMGMDYAAH